MARPGVTYHDVAHAALELSGQGKAPTIDNVRQHLGTGSSSTIGPHLKTWKERQSNITLLAHKEKLPEELVILMKGLWDQVLNEAHAQITLAEQTAEQALSTLKQKFQQSEQEKAALEQQRNQLKQHEQQLLNNNLALNEALTELQKKHIALETESKTHLERLAEKQERINELQRLHQQAQHNLEHYRESAREERLKEQQHYEHRLQSLEQSQQYIAKENHELKNQCAFLQKKTEDLQAANQQLQEQHGIALTDINTLASQLALTQDHLAHAQAAAEKWQKDASDNRNALEIKQHTLTELQTQLTRLAEKHSLTEKQLNEITQQNKSLAHEKWELGQEAAKLLGQLKQLSTAR